MVELTLPAFTTGPASADRPPTPGVVVIHDGRGMSGQILRLTERLAREGYLVTAPDFFFRSHGTDPDDYRTLIDSVSVDDLEADLSTAADALRAAGATSVGVTGFCMGGWFTYRAAKWADRLGVSAAVAFYGGGIAGELGDLRCPTLFLFGGADPHITPEAVERVRDRHPDSEVVVFPGADHGFMRDGSDSFHPDAAADGWRRMLAFFDEHLD